MSPDAVIGAGALWVAVPLALLAGLLSFVSPCVLPLVPGYLGFIAGAVTPRAPRGAVDGSGRSRAIRRGERGGPAPAQAITRGLADRGGSGLLSDGRLTAGEVGGTDAPSSVAVATAAPPPVARGRLVGGVLLFIAGFTVVFLAAVILGGGLGRWLIAYQDVITRILGIAVIALGLVFLGGLGPLQRTLRVGLRNNLGLVGAPLLGVALGLAWTPCIGPTLAAIIAVSYTLGDPARAAVLGLAYSAGLGIPFVLLALGLGWATRSVAFVRRHIRAFNVAGGVVLVVLGVLMLTGLWTALMSLVQSVVVGVPLPL